MSKQARTVLVTAGASGIGWHTAKGFLAQGAQVHICDNSAAAIAAMAKEEPDITATLADAASVSEVNRVFEEIKNLYGGLDVWLIMLVFLDRRQRWKISKLKPGTRLLTST